MVLERNRWLRSIGSNQRTGLDGKHYVEFVRIINEGKQLASRSWFTAAESGSLEVTVEV